MENEFDVEKIIQLFLDNGFDRFKRDWIHDREKVERYNELKNIEKPKIDWRPDLNQFDFQLKIIN